MPASDLVQAATQSAGSLLGGGMKDIPGLITIVGALGIAAFGIVDALGKTVFVFDPPWARQRNLAYGLPYAGFGAIRRLLKRVEPAMKVTYGDAYGTILINQYRAGRSQGQAPEMIRQGVRLGLPYLSQTAAEGVIAAVWGMSSAQTAALAQALTAEKTADAAAPAAPDAGAAATAAPQALAARFATALDTSVQAAFASAEQRYQSWAQFWAGVAAVVLSLGYEGATAGWPWAAHTGSAGAWIIALLVGLAAVPLAPVAKDLSSSLSQALTALGQVRAKTGG
jgi:hypothetical protein